MAREFKGATRRRRVSQDVLLPNLRGPRRRPGQEVTVARGAARLGAEGPLFSLRQQASRGDAPGRAQMKPPLPSASMRRSSRSEEHTSELQSLRHLVCRLLLEKK